MVENRAWVRLGLEVVNLWICGAGFHKLDVHPSINIGALKAN